MRRFAILVPSLLLVVAACATYKDDLTRARAYYDRNQYEPALALFRVLEQDIDSFSIPEQAQYAYSRGMTDYRLAGLANPGTGAADPKHSFRANARHWLAVAAAIEKQTPGGLTGDEKQRLAEAITDLNRDVYGGSESLEAAAADGGAPEAGKK
jgi:hypothetical protein